MAHAWWHPRFSSNAPLVNDEINNGLSYEEYPVNPAFLDAVIGQPLSKESKLQRELDLVRMGGKPQTRYVPRRAELPSTILNTAPSGTFVSKVGSRDALANPIKVDKQSPVVTSSFVDPVKQDSPFSKTLVGQMTEQSTPENQRNLDRKVMSPFAFMPNPDSTSKVVETQETKPSLWETWGSLADDPKKRKEAYLGSIKNIFMKKMLLDGIATLTGGKSQGDQWSTMAIAELDAVEKFDAEERTHNQWKALFFTEDGVYSPPANRKEALERGQQLGYDASQMKDILTVFPKEDDDRTTLEKKVAYIQTLPEGSALRKSLEREVLGMGVEDKKTNLQKEIDYMVETFNISPEEAERQAKISVGLEPRASKESRSAIEKRIESALASGAITPEEADLARRFDLLGGKEGSDKSYSARGKMISIYLKDSSVINRSNIRRPDAPSFAEWLMMPKNKASYDVLLSGDMSFTSGNSTPRQTAPQSALDYLKKNPSQAQNFKDKYGYLPEGY
jgi:hypothetical protein